MPQKSRIEIELSDADRAEFNRLLATGRLSIDALTTWLEGKGYEISRSAVGRYAQGYERTAARLRQSRAITESLVSELGDAATQGKQGRLLVEMARSLVYDLMDKLQVKEGVADPKDAMMLGKALAELGKALRFDQDFETKVREQVAKEEREKAAAAVATVAKEAGLSEETAATIRAKIFGAK